MAKPKIKIVTGYVPIIGHPYPVSEYAASWDKMGSLVEVCPIQPFIDTHVEETWLYKFIASLPGKINPAEGDQPKKNTVAYHCVQHEKFKFLLRAMEKDDDTDTFIWMDCGIFRVPGVGREPIVEFLGRIKKDDLAIPGIWTRFDPRCESVGYFFPNWRFCGGVMVVPRRFVGLLYNAVALMAAMQIKKIHYATWEVNTLASVEKENVLPIRWYAADHDAKLFTGY